MKRKKPLFFLLAAALSIRFSGICADAAEQIQNGVKVEISAGKTAYSADEQIAVGIRLENNSGFDITDVSVKNIIPQNYRAADGSDAVLRATYIQAGNAISGELILVPEQLNSEASSDKKTETATAAEQTVPAQSATEISSVQNTQTTPFSGQEQEKTGSSKLLIIPVIAAALCGAGFLIRKKGRGKKLVILFCIAAAGSLYPAADVKAAESETKSFSVTESVTAGGKKYDLTAEVTFTIETEDMQAAAAEYYEDNSDQIITVEAVEETSDVFTEKEAIRFMAERGFTEYPLTYDYRMDGSYADETEASPDSDEKHPMYQTYFVSDDGSIWTVFIVGRMIAANPASYNLQSDLDTQVLISETETLTSYTEMGNKLYTTIPKESAVLLRVVDQITSKKLNELTFEEVISQ
ncbi:MAG: hypothetical protein IJL32_03375 [Oscillospiraceae bacterium]|nr:hypothetical protein [Oscillospiraceae bacterium]